jgi:hypothetical protein
VVVGALTMFKALAEAEKLLELGYQIIAISPDKA